MSTDQLARNTEAFIRHSEAQLESSLHLLQTSLNSLNLTREEFEGLKRKQAIQPIYSRKHRGF